MALLGGCEVIFNGGQHHAAILNFTRHLNLLINC